MNRYLTGTTDQDIMNYMFGEDADFVEQYFGYIFQNMGDKAMWAPLWISEQRGIGKNWITLLMSKAMGMHNSRPNLKYKNVVSSFQIGSLDVSLL